MYKLANILKDKNAQRNYEIEFDSGELELVLNEETKEIKVYNMQGLLLKTEANEPEIDLSTLSTGIYLMEVSTLAGNGSYKIVKQ